MVDLPDKQYFKIGEVAELLGVKPSVLRFWETEFKSVRPEKSRTNHRLYSRKNVERLVKIKELLYDEKYTIAGARRRLREGGEAEAASVGASRELLVRIRKELQELLQLADE